MKRILKSNFIYFAAALLVILLVVGVFFAERSGKQKNRSDNSVGISDMAGSEKSDDLLIPKIPERPSGLGSDVSDSQVPEEITPAGKQPEIPAEEPTAKPAEEPEKSDISGNPSSDAIPADQETSGVPGAESAAEQDPEKEQEPSSATGVVPGVPEEELHATLSVTCTTLIGNSSLDAERRELVPADGVIYAPAEVVFYEGESVFNLLAREMRQKGIHMEFVSSAAYHTAYIEGIGNLYEFDAGELSGWMYRVNGVFPNKGCSSYTLSEGDVVEWLYTCDLGKDVGAPDAAMEEQKSDE